MIELKANIDLKTLGNTDKKPLEFKTCIIFF